MLLLFDCGGVSGFGQRAGIPTERLMIVAVFSVMGKWDEGKDHRSGRDTDVAMYSCGQSGVRVSMR